MKVITLPKTFPISEIFAFLDIYILKSRELESYTIIEMSEFDYFVLKDYLRREGQKYGVTEL